MRAITTAPGVANSTALEEQPEPTGADALLVEAVALGICGTDMEILAGAHGAPPEGRPRMVLGHESLGRVLEAPPKSGFTRGDMVVGIVRHPDPVPCRACAGGEWDMCENGLYTERGIRGLDGFGAERYRLEPDFAVKVEPALGLAAVLLEPASVLAKAWDHIERIGGRTKTWSPRRVLVTGAGPVGLLGALMAVQRGYELHVYDRNTTGLKPRLVRDLGGTYHCDGLESLADLAADVALECTGAGPVVLAVMAHARPSAVVCLTGLSSSGRRLELDVAGLNRSMVLENNVVFGSVNANRAHYELAAVALVRADADWLDRLITRRVPLNRWREAYERRPDDVKVVIDFSAELMSGLIEDYALIGDCETAALVGRDGSIDWLCWPRFDSDACFAALLGDSSNGRWRIAPTLDGATASWRYRPNSLILETRYQTAEGAVCVTDFMPPRGVASDIVRLVTGLSGRVEMSCEFIVRFGYGKTLPWVKRLDDGGLSAVAGPDRVVLRTPVALLPKGMTTVATFTVNEGDAVPFVLTYGLSHLPLPAAIDPAAALSEAEAFWCDWTQRGDVSGPYSEAIRRSLITLKALTHAPTGGVVAAPTTSLPEQFGGARNWDYRFCWVRDATLTLLSLMNAGYFEEASAWRDWLLRAVAGSPDQMQIMYGLAGERRLTEWIADWLPGYEAARPVRIGNAAHSQFQLDVYGELMDALHQARKGGLAGSEPAWAVQRVLLKHVEANWDEPDEGLWEIRGGRRHFTFSKVMAWVALDRAIKEAEQFGLDGDVAHWRALRTLIHESVCAQGYDASRNTFIQSYGKPELDASLLLLAEVGFLAADDPRFIGTVAAIERELLRDGFLLRYDTGASEDGLPPGEGAFLACSFWLVDAWLMIGRRKDAEALFERLLAVRNDLGLLAEEYDPRVGRLCGNFPQAFSHIGLINAAFNLTRAAKPTEQRSERSNPKTNFGDGTDGPL